MSSLPEVDPTIFKADHEFELSVVIINYAELYSTLLAKTLQYERQNSTKAKDGLLNEVKELPVFGELVEMLGSEALVESISVEAIDNPVEKEEYEAALLARLESFAQLAATVFGYQEYMFTNLAEVFHDQDEASSASWAATWKKLRNTLRPVGGTILAEVADGFDELIRMRYPRTYDHTDRLRGVEARQDISACAFYEELEEHLTRSIVKRPDEWA